MTSTSVVVNGRPEQLSGDGPSVADLFEQLGLSLSGTAVVRGKTVIVAADYEATTLQAGDELEIIHIVGGG